ncbi:hypothetical protein C8J57DRAFT_1716040, partial [Mycena rebaudengoi]
MSAVLQANRIHSSQSYPQIFAFFASSRRPAKQSAYSWLPRHPCFLLSVLSFGQALATVAHYIISVIGLQALSFIAEHSDGYCYSTFFHLFPPSLRYFSISTIS